MIVWVHQSGFRHEGYSLRGIYKTKKEAIDAAEKLYEKQEPYPSDIIVASWDLEKLRNLRRMEVV